MQNQITQEEIDNLPPPPKEWLDGLKPIKFKVKYTSRYAKAKKVADIIKDFWERPKLLKSKTFEGSSCRIANASLGNKNGEYGFYCDKDDMIKMLKEKKPEVYAKTMKEMELTEKEIKLKEAGVIVNKEIDVEYFQCVNDFCFLNKSFYTYPKGFDVETARDNQQLHIQFLKEYRIDGDFNRSNDTWKFDSKEKYLINIKQCFNIIENWRPFEALEKCGIEVMYAKKCYSNRGSIDALKKSLKENKIKMKQVGGRKKDAIIKFLLKLE